MADYNGTASGAELDHCTGVTSAIQTQLNAKAPVADPTFTGEIGIGSVNVSETELGILEGATLSTTELNYVDGVTSSIQTQLNTKQTLDAFKSLAVADLSDTTTPSVLTTAESTNKAVSNYKATGADHVFTMPAAHSLGNIIFIVGDEFQVDIEPDTGDLFYLNGTAMAANEHIQNTADTLGDQIVGYCANINGTLRWMFSSSSANWVEETP